MPADRARLGILARRRGRAARAANACGQGRTRMQPPEPQLYGRVVVVTGGARGMGRAFVRGALAANARVVATDLSWAGVDDFRAELAGNDRALVLDMDVTDEAQIDDVFDQTIAKFGTTDVLINNAALLNMFLF